MALNDPQEANTSHKSLSTAPVSFILEVSAVGMASLANSSRISKLLVFYPEPMPAHFTECPYCRKIYHSIHLHPLQIINDLEMSHISIFFPKCHTYIAIASLYIETIQNLLFCSLAFVVLSVLSQWFIRNGWNSKDVGKP